ncbi:MarR family winged helix-turn-helix transcriptional regulator [Streptomyces carpinensis]|uniref:MarR family winged helix-turn-helix transcriptional regulator n=1 Tax=Streptomyces carpinensis TaxID=66369 RepID=A0ABV1W0A4_9ACTN|nr:MarR family winged helix-turn-helix transcriptional regulator [Streptomyces carpinensis]
MSGSAREAPLGDVVRQLTAIAAIRRRLVRRLPQGLGNGSAVLAALAHCGETRLQELAHHLDCTLSVVSRQVAYLEQQGAVTRRVNPEDRRSSLVSITPGGRALVDALVRVHTDLIASATADWAPQELTTLTTLLERLQDGLSRRMHGAEPRNDAPDRTASSSPSSLPHPAPGRTRD